MSKDNVIHFMPRPVAPASPAITPRHAINNDTFIIPGFIFVPCPDEHAASLPPAYLVERLGSFGYYGKLNLDHINGFEFVKAEEYHVQSCLCAMLKPGRKPHITKIPGAWKVTPVPMSHNYDSMIVHRYRLAWSFANKRNQSN